LGHWRSLSGMLAYHRTTLQLSSRIADKVHDAARCPTATLQYIYGTPAEFSSISSSLLLSPDSGASRGV
jgi:hypothetical protein